MSTAVCNECGKEFRWSARRGCKLSDVMSPCCKSGSHGVRRGMAAPQTHPRVSASVYKPDWQGNWKPEPQRCNMYILPSGKFQVGHWINKYLPTDEIIGGYRFFKCNGSCAWGRCGIEHKALVKEEDYQRLLTKQYVQEG